MKNLLQHIKNIRGSIAFRYLSLTALIFMSAQIVLKSVDIQTRYNQQRESLAARVEAKAKLLKAISEESIPKGDLRSLETLSREISQDEDIVYGVILNNENELFTQYVDFQNPYIEAAISQNQLADLKSLIDIVNQNPDIQVIQIPIQTDNAILGQVWIGYSTHQLRHEFVDLTVSSAASALLISGLLTFTIAILFRREIFVPLQQLNDLAQALAQGKLDQRAQIKQANEIGQLQLAFNSMAEQLQQNVEGLQKQEILLWSIIDRFPHAVYWKDLQGRYLGCNQAFATDAGFATPFEVIGCSDAQMPWQNEAHLYQADDQEVIQLNQPKLDIQVFVSLPNLPQRWLRTSKVPLLNTAGDVIGVVGTYEDITDRKRSDEAIRQSQEKFSRLFHQSNDGVLLYDLNGTIVDVNKHALEQLEYDRYEILCLKINQLHPDSELSKVAATLIEMQHSGYVRFETYFQKKNGDTFPAEVSASVLEIDHQPLVQSIVRDITERKQSEELLQQRIDKEQLIKSIMLRVRQFLDLDKVLDTTVEEVRNFLQCDRVLVYRFQADWSGYIAAESVGASYKRIMQESIHDPCFGKKHAHLYQNGHISNIENVYRAGLKDCYVQFLEQIQVKASLVVPIIQVDQLWGLLIAHQCSSPRPWQALETDLLQQLATQVSIAVQQSELYQTSQIELAERKLAEQNLRESEAALRALHEVTSSHQLDFDRTLQMLLDLGCQQFDLEMGSLARVEGNRYEVILSQNRDGKTTRGSVYHLDQTFCQYVIQTKKPIVINSAMHSKWRDHLCHTQLGIEGYLGAPIVVNDQIYGTLNFLSSTPRLSSFKALDRELLMLMAQWIGGEIERQKVARELADARDKALEATRAKSDFLAMMSHEIRTPMNAVIGMTGLLLDTQLTTEQQDFAETVRSSGDALLTIINDILDFSKIESGKLELEEHPFAIRQCVEESFDLLASRASDKGLEMAYQIERNVPPLVLGDITRLRQILVNLLSNAVKFTHTGEIFASVSAQKTTHVLTQSEPSEDWYTIQFSVHDTGIGIPPERMDRLFVPFSQVDSSVTRKYGGTGLGLVICKQLAELMGGTMWVASEPNQGSTFVFTIQTRVAQTSNSDNLYAIATSDCNLAGKKLLIVDDNTTNREILIRQLQYWNIETIALSSGAEALRWLSQDHECDIAILDMQMPEMDGLMLAASIRQITSRQDLPLIMLTSVGRHGLNRKQINDYFVSFLNKPVKQSQLFNALIDALDHQPAKVQYANAKKPEINHSLAEQLPLKILVAEDNGTNQKLALLLLQRMGYRPDIVANGLEVIEAVRRQVYDVILMDLHMPEMDGIAATKEIHKNLTKSRPRIVAMTANAMSGDRQKCLEAGMDDYISKPIQVTELVQALEMCRRSTSTESFPVTDENLPDISVPLDINPSANLNLSLAEDLTIYPNIPKKLMVQSLNSSTVDFSILHTNLSAMGDDPKQFLTLLLSIFLEETPHLLQRIESAIGQDDDQNLRFAAHTLKSSSAGMGATQLSELCRQLEAIGNHEMLGNTVSLLDQVKCEYDKVKTTLSSHLESL